MADLHSKILNASLPLPPWGPNSFNFMQFWGKIGKIICWRLHLGEILDLPLRILAVLAPRKKPFPFNVLLWASFQNLLQLFIPEVFFHFFLQGAEPEMTCVGDFGNVIGRPGIHTDTLDYVWFSHGSLEPTGTLGTPQRSVLLSHTGLPSPLFPSDHLPLKACFQVL